LLLFSGAAASSRVVVFVVAIVNDAGRLGVESVVVVPLDDS
jgi:hypothetical protein